MSVGTLRWPATHLVENGCREQGMAKRGGSVVPVVSFLVKDLLIPWQAGAKWFWDTLVDADLANNTLGWQWTAECGADAAPYSRVFSPIQGERFDPDGGYVRRWVLQVAGLPDRYIHRPWEASGEVLKKANISLSRDYPRPVINHDEARVQALGAYEMIRRPP